MRSFSDVSSNQAAISWAADCGILAGDEFFRPQRSLTRQELATALYGYYTKIAGRTVTSLAGVGGYEDRVQLSDAAASAYGWAMQQELLTAENGYLRPQALVSRGQLAVALAKFLQILA